MGDGVTPPPLYYPNKPSGEQTLSEYLTDFIAYYITIGMPRDEVLYGERSSFDDYDRAYEYKQMQTNRNLHLQGYYDYMAVSCALSSAFADKGKKGTPYPAYPTPITEDERKAEKERNIRKTLTWVRERNKNARH